MPASCLSLRTPLASFFLFAHGIFFLLEKEKNIFVYISFLRALIMRLGEAKMKRKKSPKLNGLEILMRPMKLVAVVAVKKQSQLIVALPFILAARWS